MNGWAHLIKAIGLAVIGNEDDEPAAPTRAKRNPYARKKGCCNAKRASSGTSSTTADPGAPAVAAPGLGGVRGVRSGSGE